jgi:ABC-type glucose/galactose transport system permease subunit
VSPENRANNQLTAKNRRSPEGPSLKPHRLRIDATTYGSTVVLIIGIIITAIFQPVFLTVSNISNVLSQIAVLGILTM